MAVLVLLGLMGLGMMIATRGERKKLTPQRETLALETIMGRAIRIVRQRLRDDLVRDPSRLRDPNFREDPSRIHDPAYFDPKDILGGDPNDPNAEGEAFDAPCLKDQWLASTIPWPLAWDPSYGDPNLIPNPDLVLVWPRVSCLGNPEAAPPPIARLNVAEPNFVTGDKALTNRLTEEGDPNLFARFDANIDPFDPNLYRVMLFDADGDGMPDSPISFTFPIDTPTPTAEPKQVHVAIRIVDNCSKVNVCTAGVNDPADPTYERRGRWLNDILLNPPIVPLVRGLAPTLEDTAFLLNWPNSIMDYREKRLGSPDHPNYTADDATDPNRFARVGRGRLFAGSTPGFYSPFVEGALTRRNVLIPKVEDIPTANTLLAWALPETLSPGAARNPFNPLWRWRRLEDRADYNNVYMNPSLRGIFRRSLFTTRSFDVLRRAPLRYLGWSSQEAVRDINGDPDRRVLIVEGVQDAMRDIFGYEKFDLNYVDPNDPTNPALLLMGLANCLYGGNIVRGGDGPTRMRNAWRLALNIVDYRDPDGEPTVLTRIGSTAVDLAGVETQPFITEGFIKVIAGTDPPNDTELFYAAELYVPGSWNIDPNGLALNGIKLGSGPGAFGVSAALTGAMPDGTFYVFANNNTDSDIPGTALTDSNFAIARRIELTYDPVGTPAPYAIDRIIHADLVGPNTLIAGTTYVRTIQRNTSNWRWTVGNERFVATDVPPGSTYVVKLGAANTNGPGNDEVDPCPWWFRNAPWTLDPDDPDRWAFDSVGDLSRVLAVGYDSTDANGTGATPGQLWLMQDYYRTTLGLGAEPDDRVAAGRLDFMRHDSTVWIDPNANDPNGVPTNVFDYFTTIAAGVDRIDNDGDGRIDNDDPSAGLGEADDINYRVAGRINLNTAPEYVLRTVPFLYDDHLQPFGTNKTDLAAGIVTFREGRPMFTPVINTFTQPTSANINWFRTLGDLTRIRRGNPALNSLPPGCLLDYYGRDNVDLKVAPDYDANEPNDPNVVDDVGERDILLARSANLLTVRSDTYTVYIALIDSVPDAQGRPRYLRRCQFTLDRTNCFGNLLELPTIVGRVDTNYYDDTR